ncbi:MAG TPA: NAD-dependent epimerase/dehydratase family protein [Pirellulales bacterium]|nr:NAD-dependent epimerase/dehydratase family protein [Pirellulales bacterium]
MNRQTVLVTGGYGCIGAETSKWLLRNSDASVVVCSRSVSEQRTERVFHDGNRERLAVVRADVTDQKAMQEILSEHQVTHVVHLAALQTPDCNARRNLGLQINVAGTLNVIEAMKASGLKLERFIFASSIAVYGPRATYPEGRVPMLVEPNPANLYGAWKLAGEHISRIFCEETGVATLSLRPGVLYGPGRDAGLTSSPTTAMKHVALGRAFEIPFRSRQDYLFAPDVGGAIGTAVLEPFDGYGAFTLPSLTLTTDEIVASMRRVAAGMGLGERFRITVGNEDVPFICDLEYEPFVKAFPNVPHTPLDEAVRKSLEVFLEHARRGWIGD